MCDRGAMEKQELLDLVYCFSGAGGMNQKLITLMEWVKCLIQGRSPFDQLMERGINAVVVYGVTELGSLFVQEALKEDYKVLGITDKRVSVGRYDFCGIPVFTIEELRHYQEEYIIVTAVNFWNEIKLELDTLGFQNVIALWDLM